MLVYTASDGKNHKVQASGERRIYAVATQFWVWLCESRIDDPHLTELVQYKRTVLMDRAWDSAVAFAVKSQRIRRAKRHKCCNEVPSPLAVVRAALAIPKAIIAPEARSIYVV